MGKLILVYLNIWKWLRVPIAPCPHEHQYIQILAGLVDIKYYWLVILICILLMAGNIENFYVYWLFRCFFVLKTVQVFCSFLNFLSLCYRSVQGLHIFRIWVLYGHMYYKYLLPDCDLSFHFLDNIFWWTEVFNFIES